MAGTKVKRTGVSEYEVPSAKWGWSGEAPKFFSVMAILVAILLVLMALIGNHHGHVEDIWMIGLAIGLVAIVARDAILKRKPR